MTVFVLIVLAGIGAVVTLSVCRAAASSDQQLERVFNEWLVRQPKETQPDTCYAAPDKREEIL